MSITSKLLPHSLMGIATPASSSADQAVTPAPGDWEKHWTEQAATGFGAICSWYRRHIRSRSVAHYFDRDFSKSGVFAECGSGSSETSCRIPIANRKLIAVDWCQEALKLASRVRQISECIQADIRALPFADHSLDGIWNLGVMEHFARQEQLSILLEFRRVLKPSGRVLLWWPPTIALDHLLVSRFGWRFPAEPGRVTRQEALDLLQSAGFVDIAAEFPFNDCLTELVVRAASQSV